MSTTSKFRTAANLPADHPSLVCAALVRPGSSLHQRLFQGSADALPVWGIYERDRCFAPAHQLRFGDGSGVTLTDADLHDVLLLLQIGDSALQEVFA